MEAEDCLEAAGAPRNVNQLALRVICLYPLETRMPRPKRFKLGLVLIVLLFGAGSAAVVALQIARETPGLQQDGSFLVTTNQAVTPVGIVRRLESARPKDMALSPDGATLAVLCTKYAAFFHIAGELLQKVAY